MWPSVLSTSSSLFSIEMNTLYTMIAEPNELKLESHFYCVEIGNNPRAHKALFALSRYCSENNFYFRKRSRGDDIFRLKVAASLGCKVYELPCMDAKVETLVSYLRKHGQLPWQPANSGNLHFMKAISSPSYLLLCNTKCLKRGTL